MKILITEEQAKFIFGQKNICPKCKHIWEVEKKDKEPKLCHWCGWDDENENYNDNKLFNFWKKESKKDLNKPQWVTETKKWNQTQKNSFNQVKLLNEIEKLLNESVSSGTPIWELMQELFEGIMKKGDMEALSSEEKKFIQEVFENSDQEGRPTKQFIENENKLTPEAFQFFKNNFETFIGVDFLKKIYPTADFNIPKINYESANSSYETFKKSLIETENCDYCEKIKKILDEYKTWGVLDLEKQKNLWEITKNARKSDKTLSENTKKLAEQLETEIDNLISSTEKNLNFSNFETSMKNLNITPDSYVKFTEKLKDLTTKKSFEEAIRKFLKNDSFGRNYVASTLEETFGEFGDIFQNGELTDDFLEFLNREKPNFIRDLTNGKYGNSVDANGKWSPLNKLDTNSTDNKTLFEDYVSKYYSPKTIETLTDSEFDEIMTKFKNDCEFDPQRINDLISENPEKYTKNILKNSVEGKEIEKNFEKKLTEEIFPGSKIVFKGGDGNALDKTGWDMVLKLEDGTFVPIQVKKGTSEILQKPNIKGEEGLRVYVKSNVNLRNGLLCIQDSKGNWVIFPPQQKYMPVKNGNIEGAYEFKGKFYQPEPGKKGFTRSGTHYIDPSDGDQIWFGGPNLTQPKKVDVDISGKIQNL